MQGIGARLAGNGFEVLVMELRGHGIRPGPCTFGARETEDALAILQWAENQSGHLPIGLLGFSMGATVMCQAATRLAEVKALVADSIYAELFPILSRGLWQERRLPRFPFAWCTWAGLQLALGVSLKRFDATYTAEKLNISLLLIEGGQDRRVPRRWVDDWYARWAGNKERWCDAEAGHVGVFPKNPSAYASRVSEFFERMLR